MKKLDLLVTGVGGQGVILASDIIGEAALADGYDIKKTDTLGMAQRGGSVISNMRIAPTVWSPLIKEGDVDVLLSFEKLEAAKLNILMLGCLSLFAPLKIETWKDYITRRLPASLRDINLAAFEQGRKEIGNGNL